MVASILEAANGGARKTRILYKTYLSNDKLNRYIQSLISKGLLRTNESQTLFKTTEKGIRFLQVYEQFEFLNPVSVSSAAEGDIKLNDKRSKNKRRVEGQGQRFNNLLSCFIGAVTTTTMTTYTLMTQFFIPSL